MKLYLSALILTLALAAPAHAQAPAAQEPVIAPDGQVIPYDGKKVQEAPPEQSVAQPAKKTSKKTSSKKHSSSKKSSSKKKNSSKKSPAKKPTSSKAKAKATPKEAKPK